MYVPVINCDKADFELKLENKMHIVDDCKIPIESLYFVDELIAEYGLTYVKETILVDHNILDPSQSDLTASVTKIIDHHEDRKAYDD